MNSLLRARNENYHPDEVEREYACLAHFLGALAALLSLGLFPPFLPPLITLWLNQRRGPFFLFHLNQTIVYQILAYGVYLVLVLIVTLVATATFGVGVVYYFFCLLVLMGTTAYPIVVGLAARKGEWREFEWVGEYVLHRRQRIIGGN